MTVKDSYVVKSVEKAVQLLQALAKDEGGGLGVSELSRRLGFNKNQTFRLAKTLEQYGLVEQDNVTGAYRLGIGLFSLAVNAHDGLSLVQVAAPVMDKLAQITGESVHLTALHHLEAVVVDVRESPQNVRLTATIGGRYPLHAGACPQAMLANLPDDLRQQVLANLPELPRYTPQTIVDSREQLAQRLATIRERGYAISDEDVDVGARSVGAAILDRTGFPVGAVSVAGPSSRLSVHALTLHAKHVCEAADEIASRLRLAAVSNYEPEKGGGVI